MDQQRPRDHLRMLQARLSNVSDVQALAFAATCCVRMYPYYRALTSFLDSEWHTCLHSIIDRIWDHILGKVLDMKK